VLWQLSLPSSYLQWSVSEWQSTMNILETQEFTGGGANVSMGVLANSQGTAIDQVFQLLAPNGFVVRLVDGNSIPVNSVGVTMPVPTEALVWSAPGALPGASMTPLWDEWIPPITEYPQLTALAESHISAEMQDLKTSGQQIWQVLHPSSGASSSPSQSSSPSSNSSTSSAPPVTFGKTFPNLEGLTATQAASLLHAVNAHIGTSTSVYSTEPLNTIINQAPQPYASQAQGDAVTVTLSRGPSPTSARLSKNATATTWQIPNSAPSQSLLKIVVTDSAGNEEVFYQQVNPDQQVKIPFTWYGTNGQLVAFLNGQEQPPQPLAVNNSTPSSVVGSASPSP
jgi:serine/threonine-protein kinase